MHLQVRVTHAGELIKHASFLFRSSPSVSFSSACSVRVSLLLYLILPSWFLALDRGWSAMKSSPIATRLVYIYRTHRGTVKRRKVTWTVIHTPTPGPPQPTHHTHSEMTETGNKQQTKEKALWNYRVSSAGQRVLTPQNRTAATSDTASLRHVEINGSIRIKSVRNEENKCFNSPARKAECLMRVKILKEVRFDSLVFEYQLIILSFSHFFATPWMILSK